MWWELINSLKHFINTTCWQVLFFQSSLGSLCTQATCGTLRGCTDVRRIHSSPVSTHLFRVADTVCGGIMGCWWCYTLKVACQFQIVTAEIEATLWSKPSVQVHYQVNPDWWTLFKQGAFYSNNFYIHFFVSLTHHSLISVLFRLAGWLSDTMASCPPRLFPASSGRSRPSVGSSSQPVTAPEALLEILESSLMWQTEVGTEKVLLLRLTHIPGKVWDYISLCGRSLSRHSDGENLSGEPDTGRVCHLPWPPHRPVQIGKTRIWPWEQI